MNNLVSKVLSNDILYILSKRSKLIKELSLKQNLLNKKIAILSGTSSQEICNFLNLFLLDKNFKCDFYESEFGKIFEEAVFDNKALQEFKPDIIYLYFTFFDIREAPDLRDSNDEIEEKFNLFISRFNQIISSLKEKYCAQIIVANIPYPPYRKLGNLDSYSSNGTTCFVMRLNNYIAEYCSKEQVILHDLNYLSAQIGLDNYYDLKQWNMFRFAQSQKATMHISYNLSSLIASIFGKQKKLLITDLDNTLWGGVIGDDGVDKIHIGYDTPKGEIFSLFQEYIMSLYVRGVVLAICSKNDIENALLGLSRGENLLKKDDFAVIEANWDNKDSNIQHILNTLSLGADGAVFVDDNPIERDLVKKSLDSISIVDENNIYKFISYIDKAGFFEPISISKEDFKRNEMYKANIKRNIQKSTFANYNEYLKSLDTVLTIGFIGEKQKQRCCQLINKTNQFNLTGKRFSEAEFESFLINKDNISLYGKVTDKYGDSGLISVILATIDSNSAVIECNLMSCRVLKRNIEYGMMDCLVNICKARNIKEIIARYIKTDRNAMVKNLYSDFGFSVIVSSEEEILFKLRVNDYITKSYNLKIKGDF